MEEGKTSSVSDFIIRSPNIQKKRMDFGQGLSPEYTWFYPSFSKDRSPRLLENLKDRDIRIQKLIHKWDRVFILDSMFIHLFYLLF